MFTLKLYRRKGPESHQKTHKIMAVNRVVVHDIGEQKQALELMVFPDKSNDYETYYIGKPEEGMEAFGRGDLHLGMEPSSWWGWGLLENQEGNTSEHYRPHNYG
jgi:hypothetical protein